MGRLGRIAPLAVLAVALVPAAVAQAAAPGSQDPSFGSGGVVALTAGTQLFAVAVQSNGEVVAAGQSGGNVLVERFTTTGAPDGTYEGPAGYARGVAIQANGDVVLAGTSGGSLFVERLTAALTPDPSFGSGGTATALSGAVANAVAIAPDGNIVAAGSDNGQVAVAQFSAGGAVLWSEALDFGANSQASGVAVQPADNKIVLVGQQRPLQVTNGVIARLNTDGSLDGTFAGGGATTYHYPGGGYTTLTAVAIQNDGQIVAAGADAGGPNALLLRYTSSGALDPNFGSGGVTAMLSGQQISVPGTPVGAYGIAIGGGGAIIGAGMFQTGGGDFDGGLWATTSTGAPQATFGSGGTARGPLYTYEECGLAVAPDGSLVAVGNVVTVVDYATPCAVNGDSPGFVARYIGFGPPPAAPSPPSTPTTSTPSSPSVPTATSGAPVATTGSASATEVSLTVPGTVAPNGLASTYWIQYGTKSAALSSSTKPTSLLASSTTDHVSVQIGGLSAGTTYYYRLVAHNSSGTSYGAIKRIQTEPKLSAKLGKLAPSYATAGVRAHGLALGLSVNQSCTATATLQISASTARSVGLGHTTLAIARTSGRLRRAGTLYLTLRLSVKTAQALAHHTAKATLGFAVQPVGGGRSVMISRTVTLRG